jgi:hypothetical protein
VESRADRRTSHALHTVTTHDHASDRPGYFIGELRLSEGEQTVLGLAGFFTEAEFDPSKSAVIFDDPVTSLDHVRRDKVADRLVQFAKSRQVIVFTHDIAFLTDLLKSADSAEVEVYHRTIQRRGTVPGYVAEGLPWKAQDIGLRLNTIQNEITKLTKRSVSNQMRREVLGGPFPLWWTPGDER